MPKTIKVSDWKAITGGKIPPFKQSAKLRELTQAFEVYELNPTQAKLGALDAKFKAWTADPKLMTELLQVGTTSADLEYTVKTATGPGGGTTSVKPMGWTYQAFDASVYSWTFELAVPQQQPPLSGAEITRLNEAFRRSRRACEIARDTLLRLGPSDFASGGALPMAPGFYVRYFGAYDKARFDTVLNNFKVLAMAFERGPTVVDLRNTDYGTTCYAACFRRDISTRDKNKSLNITSGVDMFLGRFFFTGGGAYGTSTDNTVGTLVHEFAHGAVNAVDAPRVFNGAWELTPKHLTDPTHADYGETPDNALQSSTEELDTALAVFEPSIAIRNADSYGLFATAMLKQSQS